LAERQPPLHREAVFNYGTPEDQPHLFRNRTGPLRRSSAWRVG
jgi:hypothetical protein